MDESEVLKFEQQQRITKLSQAIREGAKLRPQCIGYGDYDGALCAIQAAQLAVLGRITSGPGRWAADYFGVPVVTVIDCYIDNDLGMTREAIADRLEAIGY